MKTLVYKINNTTGLLEEETVVKTSKNPFNALCFMKNFKYKFWMLVGRNYDFSNENNTIVKS